MRLRTIKCGLIILLFVVVVVSVSICDYQINGVMDVAHAQTFGIFNETGIVYFQTQKIRIAFEKGLTGTTSGYFPSKLEYYDNGWVTIAEYKHYVKYRLLPYDHAYFYKNYTENKQYTASQRFGKMTITANTSTEIQLDLYLNIIFDTYDMNVTVHIVYYANTSFPYIHQVMSGFNNRTITGTWFSTLWYVFLTPPNETNACFYPPYFDFDYTYTTMKPQWFGFQHSQYVLLYYGNTTIGMQGYPLIARHTATLSGTTLDFGVLWNGEYWANGFHEGHTPLGSTSETIFLDNYIVVEKIPNTYPPKIQLLRKGDEIFEQYFGYTRLTPNEPPFSWRYTYLDNLKKYNLTMQTRASFDKKMGYVGYDTYESDLDYLSAYVYLHFYRLTGNKSYLEFAKKLMDIVIDFFINKTDYGLDFQYYTSDGKYRLEGSANNGKSQASSWASITGTYILLHFYQFTGNTTYLDYAEKVASFLINRQQADGSWYMAYDRMKNYNSVGGKVWYTVQGGVVLLWLYKITENATYLNAANKALDYATKTLKSQGDSTFTYGYSYTGRWVVGAAAIVNAFLDGYRLTENSTYLEMALNTYANFYGHIIHHEYDNRYNTPTIYRVSSTNSRSRVAPDDGGQMPLVCVDPLQHYLDKRTLWYVWAVARHLPYAYIEIANSTEWLWGYEPWIGGGGEGITPRAVPWRMMALLMLGGYVFTNTSDVLAIAPNVYSLNGLDLVWNRTIILYNPQSQAKTVTLYLPQLFYPVYDVYLNDTKIDQVHGGNITYTVTLGADEAAVLKFVKSMDEPYITDVFSQKSNAEVSFISYSQQRLTAIIDGPSGTNSTIKIYCGSLGSPCSVTSNSTITETEWSYDSASKILTVTVMHQSAVQIVVDWNPPATGSSGGDTGGFVPPPSQQPEQEQSSTEESVSIGFDSALIVIGAVVFIVVVAAIRSGKKTGIKKFRRGKS